MLTCHVPEAKVIRGFCNLDITVTFDQHGEDRSLIEGADDRIGDGEKRLFYKTSFL